jgi:hypothetical protein
MAAMYTIRTNISITSLASFTNNVSKFDKTEWKFDPSTGLMTNKVYADGTKVKYAYGANGLLASRTWARPPTGDALTSYSYTNGVLWKVDYSDSNTPDIVYTLDRLGRQVQAVVSGVSTSWFFYNAKGQMVAETNLQGGVITGKAYVFDALGRPSGFDIGNAYSVRYGYDSAGMFVAVTATVAGVTRTFNYDWDATSGLLEGWSSGSFGVTRGYEAQRPVLAYVENKFGTNLVSRYYYTVNAGGQRSEAALSGSAFGDMGETSFGYTYNEKGELLGARREFDDAFVKEQDYQYRYDQIGNRTRS